MKTKQLNNIDIMYFHGKTIDGTRYTIAGLFENDILSLGIAVCSKYDQFQRFIGRVMSSGRLLNQRNHIGGKLNLTVSERNDYTYFNDVVSKFNELTKNDLISLFNLKNNIPF